MILTAEFLEKIASQLSLLVKEDFKISANVKQTLFRWIPTKVVSIQDKKWYISISFLNFFKDCTQGAEAIQPIKDRGNRRELQKVKKVLNSAAEDLPHSEIVRPAILSAAELVLHRMYSQFWVLDKKMNKIFSEFDLGSIRIIWFEYFKFYL